MTEGSVSSLDLDSIELRQDEAVLPPEDVAWADSCFIKDSDTSDCGWDAVRDALLETLSAQNHSSPYETNNSVERANMEISSSDAVRDALLETLSAQDHSSPDETNNSLERANMEISSSEDTNVIHNSDKPVVNIAATSEESEPNNDNPLNQEETDDFWSRHKMEDIFLPTYNENLRELGLSESEVNFVFQEVDLEQSTEDIFKVWDLDIPPEEDELIKQLKKAITQSSSKHSGEWKGLQDESLDDLISGIAELALGAD